MNSHMSKEQLSNLEFMHACFYGDTQKVKDMLKLPGISKELIGMKGYQSDPVRVQLGKGPKTKNYNVSEWNPLLLAIAN